MLHPQRTSFISTSSRGLRQDILPMRLYHKAKRLGWDPRDIDFTQDRLTWQGLTEQEKDGVTRLTALFLGGEESVTLDLLPLILAVAQDGYLEEEMFLTTFLADEAKHVEFFRCFLDEVAQEHHDLHHYVTPSYSKLYYEELPQTMNALLTDRSPAALIRASVTYNMIIEGVMAETGYFAYFDVLNQYNTMPGTREGLALLKRDEARHIAYGIFLISRLVAQDPTLWPLVEERMNELLPLALGVVQESDVYGDDPPFGVSFSSYLNFAMMQFQKRVARIERAREQSLEEVYHDNELEEDEDKAEVLVQ